MAIALIGSGHAFGGGSGSGAALSGVASIVSTGASLVVVFISYYDASGAPVLTDSTGSTYGASPLSVSGSQNMTTKMYWTYGSNLVTSGAHTFSNSTADYSALFAAAFSGTLTASDPYDVSVTAVDPGGGTQVTSLTMPAITPSQSDSLLIGGIGLRGWVAKNKPTSVTNLAGGILDQTDASTTGLLGGGLAYEIQVGAAASRTSVWGTFPNSDFCAAITASFKPSGGAAPTDQPYERRGQQTPNEGLGGMLSNRGGGRIFGRVGDLWIPKAA